jgi:aminoglycoside phosphotransferase (APT) family kinase protein
VTVTTDLNTALLAELRAVTGRPGLDYAEDPEPLSGGFWAELRAFTLADPPPGWPADLVARVMPDAGTARKETIMQAAIAAAGFPTPQVRASGGPGSGLGRAFMIMDRAAGKPLIPGLSGVRTILSVLRTVGRLPEILAAAMTRLHALDPRPVSDQLAKLDDVPVTEAGLLALMAKAAPAYQRPDLTDAAAWLIAHPPPPAPDVVCHGDLHPFNLLADGDRICLLDWSAALLGPRGYDVAFTSLLLSEPPLDVPAALRPALRLAGRLLASRFVRRYEAHAGVAIDPADLRWHQAVVCLRTLTDVAAWVHDGVLGEHASHPWLVIAPATAARLRTVTGVRVRPR